MEPNDWVRTDSFCVSFLYLCGRDSLQERFGLFPLPEVGEQCHVLQGVAIRVQEGSQLKRESGHLGRSGRLTIMNVKKKLAGLGSSPRGGGAIPENAPKDSFLNLFLDIFV